MGRWITSEFKQLSPIHCSTTTPGLISHQDPWLRGSEKNAAQKPHFDTWPFLAPGRSLAIIRTTCFRTNQHLSCWRKSLLILTLQYFSEALKPNAWLPLLVFVTHINLIEVCHVVHLFKCFQLLIMFKGYDHISLFVPCFDISVCLGNLLRRIAPIHDRF